MSNSSVPAAAQIPNQETESAPDGFGDGPVTAISAAVTANSSVKLFLNVGLVALAARGDLFVQQVGVRAVEIAGARKASAVDVPDVEKAAEALYPRAEKHNSPVAWAVLGILAGGIVSFLITLIAPKIAPEWTALAIGLAVVAFVGCVAWAVYLVWPRKPE